MKKYILALVFLIAILSVGAVESSFTYKQKERIDLIIPCISDDYSFCDSATNCTITVVSPDSTLVIDGQNMTYSVNYFNYTLERNETVWVGEYATSVSCCGTAGNGFTSFNFKVTPSGTDLSTGQSFIYIFFLMVSIILMVLCIAGSAKINGQNEFHMGQLVSVNFNKYIKIGLGFLAYLFLVITFHLLWQISSKFLWLDIATGLFENIYLALWILLLPVFIAFVAVSIIRWTIDLRLEKLAKRNLKQR